MDKIIHLSSMTIQVVPVIGFESVRGFGVQSRSENIFGSRVKSQALLQVDTHVKQHTTLSPWTQR